MALCRKIGWLSAFALCVLPFVAGEYASHIVVFILINTLPVVGLSFLSGFAGRVSLAQGALMGLGSYATAQLTTVGGLSPWLSLFGAIAVPLLVGVAFAGPAIRLAGLYFVMSTIGIQQIVWIVLMHWTEVTGGAQGVRSIPPLSIGPLQLDTPFRFYWIALAAACCSYVTAIALIKSRLGLQLRALSDDELAADAVAVPVVKIKVVALALSAVWAGVGGFLQAHYIRYVHPDMFTLAQSVMFLAMSMFGGYRSFPGMILATAILTAATEYLRPFGDYRPIVYGGILLVSMMFFPEGLVPFLSSARWPYFRPFATRNA